MSVGVSELDLANRQGSYGEFLVATIAAAAGLTSAKHSVDFNGLDFVLGLPGANGKRRHPQIGVQVKTWSKPVHGDGVWRYRLKARNFNYLAGPNYYDPRFLMLVIIPPAPTDWLTVDHDHLHIAKAVYWCCLHDLDPKPDCEPDSKIPIDVPKRNLVDTASLVGLFDDDYRKKLA